MKKNAIAFYKQYSGQLGAQVLSADGTLQHACTRDKDDQSIHSQSFNNDSNGSRKLATNIKEYVTSKMCHLLQQQERNNRNIWDAVHSKFNDFFKHIEQQQEPDTVTSETADG